MIGLVGPGLGHLDADHQPAPAHLPYGRHLRGGGSQPLDEQPADAPRVALEVVLDQVVEVGEARRHGDLGAAERGDAVGVQAVHDLGAGDDSADGHAVADALGEGHEVRRPVAPVSLPAPEVFARAAPAGLHLVGDPQDAVLVEHLAERRVQTVRRCGEATDALDGFGDQRGGRARVAEQVPQVLDAGGDEVRVAQGGVGAAGAHAAVDVQRLQRGQGGRGPAAVAGDADRAEGAAVVAVAHRQDRVAAPVRRGQQQGGVVGLGARGGEEDPRVRDAAQLGDALGEFDHRPVEVQGGGVDDPPGLLAHRLGDLGQRVGGHRGEDAAEEVEVPVAVGVPDVAALAVGDLDGVLVVEGEPVGEHAPVAAQEVVGHGRTSPS